MVTSNRAHWCVTFAASTCSASIVLFACASNVDVSYAKSDAATDASIEASNTFPLEDAPSIDTSTSIDAQPPPPLPCDADGGACDQTQGLGCCLPAGGGQALCMDPVSAASFCTGGVFMACQGPNLTDESACCWNGGTGAGGSTAYASSCDSRAPACLVRSDCPSNEDCLTTVCSGITVGACGTTPVCP